MTGSRFAVRSAPAVLLALWACTAPPAPEQPAKSAAREIAGGSTEPVLAPAPVAVAGGIHVVDPAYRLTTLVPPSPLRGCYGLTAGADGALYVAHVVANAISRIDVDTSVVTPFVPAHAGVFLPDDLAADGDGNLYVTSTTPYGGEVHRIEPNGRRTVIARGLRSPNGIAFDRRRGRLFVDESIWSSRVLEIDPSGAKEPRVVVAAGALGSPNGFGIDSKGRLIVPDVTAGTIVAIDPDDGRFSTLIRGLTTPAAVRVADDDEAYVVEAATGRVYRVDLERRKKYILARLPPGTDSLAIVPDGRLYVSSAAESTVYEVAADGSGEYHPLVPTGMNSPLSIVADGERVLVSDAGVVRSVAADGALAPTEINPWPPHGMPIPFAMAAGERGEVYWSDWLDDAVAVGRPDTGEFRLLAKLETPVGLASDGAGRVYVAEYLAGRVTAVERRNGAKRMIAKDLAGPIALALDGAALYVAESSAARVTRIELATGRRVTVISGAIAKPAAIALDGARGLLVLDAATRRLVRVDLETSRMTVVAEDLPVQVRAYGSRESVEVPAAMMVSPDGDVYLGGADGSVIELERTE